MTQSILPGCFPQALGLTEFQPLHPCQLVSSLCWAIFLTLKIYSLRTVLFLTLATHNLRFSEYPKLIFFYCLERSDWIRVISMP